MKINMHERVALFIDGSNLYGAARALASARSHTVGVVITTLDSAIFSSGVNALESLLREKG